jgi:RNA polymerase sigma-70 factor (ECF subfamily)
VTLEIAREVMMTVMADEELIRRVRAGETAAFDALVDRYYGTCLRFAWHNLGQREDAEDAVQEALVRAYRALRRGRTPRQFRPWLLGIVLNRCRSHAQRSRRRRLLFKRWWEREDPDTFRVQPAHDAGADDDLDPKLKAALAALGPKLREAFLLKHVEQVRYEEMAEITGASVSALKMRVKRASEQVLAMLTEDGA